MIAKKVYIKTYGCTQNQADSESMMAALANAGYKIILDPDNMLKSDLVIINSCTVKRSSENKLFGDIKKINDFNKDYHNNHPKTKGKIKIIVAGCVPAAEEKKSRFKDYNVIDINLQNVVDAVNSAISNTIIDVNSLSINLPEKIDKKIVESRGAMDSKRTNSIVEKIAINSGCMGAPCSYCKTWFARGTLVSYKKEVITKKINQAIKAGVKEIWLTSQDTAAWGIDNDETIVDLLKYILDNIPKYNHKEIENQNYNSFFKIRLGMANPNHVYNNLDRLIEIFKDERMFKFIHVPIQSGSNRILGLMRRQYNRAHFEEVVNEFRKAIPEITIATDVIIGFPSETNEEFEETVSIIKDLKIPICNISRFWPRPGTDAEKMQQLDVIEIKDRTKEMRKEYESILENINGKWKSSEDLVIIEELSDKQKENTTPNTKSNTLKSYIGKNSSYRQVLIKSKENLLGKVIKTKVNKVTKWDLRAELINN